jgi:16S rRNA (guanine527-N7)-methyltransferase
LPAAYGGALDPALACIGVSLSPIARAALDDHVRLLLAWNAAINLTSIRNPADIAVRHVVDSLVALPVLEGLGIDRFIDLGSGGGFPGIPLALAHSADRVLLVESVGKKARFLDTVVAALGESSRIGVVAVRAEALAREAAHHGRWPGVVARAVAPLADLIEVSLPLLQRDGVLIAWKSGDPGDVGGLGAELAAADRVLRAVPDATLEVLGSVAEIVAARQVPQTAVAAIGDHRLVLVRRGRRPLPAAWPRDPAARRRGPS